MTRSVHDNNVYGYAVDCKERRLTLYSEYHDSNREAFTDIVFTGLLAHRLDYVLEGNILFDIAEITPVDIVDEEAELFKSSWRYGWPPVEYNGDLEKLKSELERQSLRGYRISSSYGMSGWVLAKNCQMDAAESYGGSRGT